MEKKHAIITGIILCGLLFSFLPSQTPSSKELIKAFYVGQFKELNKSIRQLEVAVKQNQPEKKLQACFLAARLEYKKIEFILEYYYELDLSKINGPGINFVEEEDPLAFHEPQGFQVIESFLFPGYDAANKKSLLLYINRLHTLTTGLGINAASFQPDQYIPDAAMEELFRITALGITGFDSPVSHLSLIEAQSSLAGIRIFIASYKDEMNAAGIKDVKQSLDLLQQAGQYLQKNNDFDRFNRMEFIIQYMNPLTSWLGHAKTRMGYTDNPVRYGLIKKTSTLFALESLQRNRYLYDDTITRSRIELGRKLFSENALSKNGKRSCAGCHQSSRAFTDGLKKASALDQHTTLLRNTPTLWNAALQRNLFYDSRQVSLDHVISEVLANEEEMNTGTDSAVLTLHNRDDYKKLYNDAYPEEAGIIKGSKVVNALAMYVRTIVTYNSRFDQYMRGQRSAMKPNEVKGFNLFMGKALCATCHFIPLFNGSKPPLFYYQESEVIGVPSTSGKSHAKIDSDPGRYKTINRDFLKHSFKTPTLRNIALTGPYMHNGVFNTLEQVVEFYNNGGGKGLHINLDNQTLPFEKLNLDAAEQRSIISFLKTLTDTSFSKLSLP